MESEYDLHISLSLFSFLVYCCLTALRYFGGCCCCLPIETVAVATDDGQVVVLERSIALINYVIGHGQDGLVAVLARCGCCCCRAVAVGR